jgi:hypothetical protein
MCLRSSCNTDKHRGVHHQIGWRVKDFIEQLNDMVAPLTRAYSDPEIINVKVAPGDIGDTEAEFALIVKCKRSKTKLKLPA